MPEDVPVRGFSIGMAALVEDLGADHAPKGWAGSPSDLARAARMKQSLAVRQARAGQLEEACQTVEGVALIYRRLARPEPARYQPELALTLTAWGLWSSRLSRREHAAAALTDATELYRELLARAGRPRMMYRIRLHVGLAVALSNLGLARSELGEHEAATAAAEESIVILHRLRAHNPLYRMLARGNPVGFEHCLAAALNNLGLVLAARGHRERACELAVQTTESYRRLAGLAPVLFESELARALHNLGLAAAEAGQVDTALAASQESVYLHRTLVSTDSAGHRQDLGRALSAFARIRAASGRDLGEALAAAEEAVTLHEKLTADQPQAFTADLHAAYGTVSQVRAARSRRSGGSADSDADLDTGR
ncbi:MAG TPA: tetratricopeptide repeat protein [Pseudonocardia sp.]|uniref:tetratricopeptide repeat protein n=1 Tax=Pseudonocardia sp. TaxID=60912 RepID=UPI002C2CF24C|nr:tetratricopeptide repeat protein [Pseudonocardia sp.]HTF46888.1 tetratricopeptide repeat protein [Pseudonocardia sp.]